MTERDVVALAAGAGFLSGFGLGLILMGTLTRNAFRSACRLARRKDRQRREAERTLSLCHGHQHKDWRDTFPPPPRGFP